MEVRSSCSHAGLRMPFDFASKGKSDPYVVFSLNDQKVYKSQTKKKTVNPEWNESFAVQVVSNLATFV